MDKPTPRTVRVPEALAPLFVQAEAIVSGYFGALEARPEEGVIEISGQRYLLLRAKALSVEFFDLVAELYGEGREAEAEAFARNLLFDLAHAVGRSDAKAFHAKMGLVDPVARLSAGPVHFAYTGWALVEIHSDSRPAPDESFFLHYDHPHSFEAEAWMETGRLRHSPACIMNAGYSSGWCQESFGVPLVSTELLCRAKGDPYCRFIMAPPSRMEAHLEAYRVAQPHLAQRIQGVEIPDFFARKRLEEALRRSHDELEQRVKERTQALEEVHARLRWTQKLEALGRLAGGVAHDFNNLLTAILGHADMALAQPDSPAAQERSLNQIRATALRAAGLTRQLLAFSRRQVLQPESLDLAQLVRGMTEMLGPVLGEQIRLELDLDPKTGFVTADPTQLEQVLLNLAMNARDAMADGGVLHISTRPIQSGGADFVELDVADTGQGMDEGVRAHLFEPFFTTKPRGKGTGLGLATVYGIVEQSGGTVRVESEPGQGARFRVRLPRTDNFSPPAPVPPSVEGLRERGATILVVEDEAAVRDAVVEILARAGYGVLEAADPLAALTLLEAEAAPIQLLLTDLVMPHIGGAELAARVRILRPGIRVIFMSGYAEKDPGAGAAGAFLAKPFTRDALLAKVAEALGEPARGR